MKTAFCVLAMLIESSDVSPTDTKGWLYTTFHNKLFFFLISTGPQTDDNGCRKPIHTVTEFILRGLTSHPELQLPLFFFFLGIYLVTMDRNLGMITLICLNAQLHTPMYYFPSNLSLWISAIPLSLPLRCWWTLCQRRTPSPMQDACPSSACSWCLSLLSVTCWQWWPMTTMLPSAGLCFTTSSCLIESAPLLVAGVYIMGLIGSTIETGPMLKLPYCDFHQSLLLWHHRPHEALLL